MLSVSNKASKLANGGSLFQKRCTLYECSECVYTSKYKEQWLFNEHVVLNGVQYSTKIVKFKTLNVCSCKPNFYYTT